MRRDTTPLSSSFLATFAHLGEDGHNMHTHTHKTNPKSGSVSERINYWLMHSQMRNSAEPGGSSAPGAALERRIPLERYKSVLPSIASPMECYLLGKTEP